VSQESAIGLSCLSVVTSVCPASNGEQAVARPKLGHWPILQWASILRCELCWHEEQDGSSL